MTIVSEYAKAVAEMQDAKAALNRATKRWREIDQLAVMAKLQRTGPVEGVLNGGRRYTVRLSKLGAPLVEWRDE